MSLVPRAHRRLALKLAGMIFALVSVVIGGVTAYLLLHERREHEEELQHRGLLIATQLAQQSVDPILREDDYALFKLVQVVARNRGRDLTGEEIVAYAGVTDGEGMALAQAGPGMPEGAGGAGRSGETPPVDDLTLSPPDLENLFHEYYHR